MANYRCFNIVSLKKYCYLSHTEDAILQSKNDPIVTDYLTNSPQNAKYTSPEIQHKHLSLCSEKITDTIVSNCKKAGVFSVMADKCSDCFTREQLSVCVRFLDNIPRKQSVRDESICQRCCHRRVYFDGVKRMWSRHL